MHLDLYYEAFFFCSRDELEGLQLVHKSLRNKVDKGSKALPLRPIHLVTMGYDDEKDKILFFVEEPSGSGPDYEASILDGDFKKTFLRLQHTCVKDFTVWVIDSPFLRYWLAQDAAAVTVVSIDFDQPEATDYGVLDSVVNHLQPKTTELVHVEKSSWQENGDHSGKLELLARDSLLNGLQTCRLAIWDDGFPPSSFILSKPGYRNYELCCHECRVADEIDGFLKSFVRDGCTNNNLKSVYVEWDDDGDLSPLPKQLRDPTKIDAPLPKIDLTAWTTRKVHQVTQCGMHSVVNKKQWKRMKVFKWTVEYDEEDDRHTAHLLLCRVENL